MAGSFCEVLGGPDRQTTSPGEGPALDGGVGAGREFPRRTGDEVGRKSGLFPCSVFIQWPQRKKAPFW